MRALRLGATDTAAPAVAACSAAAAQTAVAGLALALGALVYLADRGSSPPALVPAFALLAIGPLFGSLGQWIPSFVHPFAFSLLTAAVQPRNAPPAYGACAAWWAINVFFEAGQQPQLHFLRGTFDVGDIAAATLGALAAATVIRMAHRLERQHA